MVGIVEITIILMVIIFFTNGEVINLPFEPLNYLLRSLQHANILHLISNSYALFQLRGFADQLGVKQFLIMMVIIWVISSALLYILHQLVPQVKTTTVGFSAVILGLTLVYYYTVTGELNFSSLNLLANILPHLFFD